MSILPTDEAINNLSKFAAAYLLTANALGLMNEVIEREARKAGQEHKRETKKHLNEIADAAKKVERAMDYFTEWAYGAAITEEGEMCSPKSYDVPMEDSSFLVQLICHVFNASYNDIDTRLTLESYAKLASKKQPIKQEYIDQLKVRL